MIKIFNFKKLRLNLLNILKVKQLFRKISPIKIKMYLKSRISLKMWNQMMKIILSHFKRVKTMMMM